MKVVATYPDAERLTVDVLTTLLAAHDPTVTVGVDLPGGWGAGSAKHVQVSWDGTPIVEHPVVAYATIRVTGWAHSTTAAKDLAGDCMALLLGHVGDGIVNVASLTGVLPARDPDSGAPIASFTVRVTVRSQPL